MSGKLDIEWGLEQLEYWRSQGRERMVNISLGLAGYTLFLVQSGASWMQTSANLDTLILEGIMATGDGPEDIRWRNTGESDDQTNSENSTKA